LAIYTILDRINNEEKGKHHSHSKFTVTIQKRTEQKVKNGNSKGNTLVTETTNVVVKNNSRLKQSRSGSNNLRRTPTVKSSLILCGWKLGKSSIGMTEMTNADGEEFFDFGIGGVEGVVGFG